jgi:hypothetical protein
MTSVRTRMGDLPGSAWISTSRCENGAACAINVTDALGTKTSIAARATSTIIKLAM